MSPNCLVRLLHMIAFSAMIRYFITLVHQVNEAVFNSRWDPFYFHPRMTLVRCKFFQHAQVVFRTCGHSVVVPQGNMQKLRSEEHTSELQSLMRISYAVFCLK